MNLYLSRTLAKNVIDRDTFGFHGEKEFEAVKGVSREEMLPVILKRQHRGEAQYLPFDSGHVPLEPNNTKALAIHISATMTPSLMRGS